MLKIAACLCFLGLSSAMTISEPDLNTSLLKSRSGDRYKEFGKDGLAEADTNKGRPLSLRSDVKSMHAAEELSDATVVDKATEKATNKALLVELKKAMAESNATSEWEPFDRLAEQYAEPKVKEPTTADFDAILRCRNKNGQNAKIYWFMKHGLILKEPEGFLYFSPALQSQYKGRYDVVIPNFKPWKNAKWKNDTKQFFGQNYYGGDGFGNFYTKKNRDYGWLTMIPQDAEMQDASKFNCIVKFNPKLTTIWHYSCKLYNRAGDPPVRTQQWGSGKAECKVVPVGTFVVKLLMGMKQEKREELLTKVV